MLGHVEYFEQLFGPLGPFEPGKPDIISDGSL